METPVAHNGVIPPLCATASYVIRFLVCAIRRERSEGHGCPRGRMFWKRQSFATWALHEFPLGRVCSADRGINVVYGLALGARGQPWRRREAVGGPWVPAWEEVFAQAGGISVVYGLLRGISEPRGERGPPAMPGRSALLLFRSWTPMADRPRSRATLREKRHGNGMRALRAERLCDEGRADPKETDRRG